MDSGSGSQPPIPGLILVAIVLGAVFFAEPPFEGSRPKEPSKTADLSSSEQTIPSRLWQDPFEAINLNRLAGDPTLEKTGESVGSPCSRDLTEIFHPLDDDQGFGVLLVLTPGSPYVEDGERRRRARYAVVSALGVAGLSPLDSQHIGCSRLAVGGGFDMPFEWFVDRQNTKASSVLVVWLPEEKFSRFPLNHLNRVVELLRFHAAPHPATMAIIGPQRSGTLASMWTELLQPDASSNLACMNNVKIYSPSATIDEKIFSQENPAPDAARHDLQEPFAKLYTEKVYKSTGDGFIKTTVSDTVTAGALAKELALRGLRFTVPDDLSVKRFWLDITEPMFQTHNACGCFDGHRDHVVLISELDTLYGRSLPKAFIQTIAGGDGDNNQTTPGRCSASDISGNEVGPRWIHRFHYLRGLDGQVPAKVRDKPASAPGRGKAPSRQQVRDIQSNIERAASTPRFDYLRRLAHRIERLDDTLRKRYCGSIKAIGILGSDIYDKLLILQALRDKFPDTLFFTTDMDARYLHPAEFKWTRNLIVGSSYGLELDVDFDADIPPFRDNYQTSRFLATLFAVSGTGYDAQAIERALVPRVYEVGRGIARDLTPVNRPVIHEKCNAGCEKQNTLSIAALLGTPAQEGTDREMAVSGTADVELGALETGTNYLEVHHAQAGNRFSELSTGHYPGHFIVAGSLLAFVLALMGAGYYIRSYFGLHPLTYMQDNWDSLLGRKPGKNTDVQLVWMTVMLWLAVLLTGMSNITVFLLLGVLIICTILIGRASKAVRESLLEFLKTEHLPLKLAFGILTVAFFWFLWTVFSLYRAKGGAFFVLGEGEPFSLRDGISMWPGEAIRVVAGIVAVGFMITGWRSLKAGDKELTDEFFSSASESVSDENIDNFLECARSRRVDWCSGEDRGEQKRRDSLPAECRGPFDAETDWIHYRVYRTLSERWNSVLFPATLFFLLGCVSIYWIDDLYVPYRGEFIYRLDHVVVFGFMVPAFLLLLFAVIDETTLCVGWVRRLTREFTSKTDTGYFLSRTKRGLDDRGKSDRDLEEIWTRLQVVARRTRRVGQLIIGPFVVLFLIMVSQSPFFDNWDIPAGLIAMILLSAAYAMLCAIKLRRVSEQARREAVMELTQQLILCGGKNDKIELLLAEIQKIKEGGFLPWTRQPWLKAMLWLLSALGIMSAEFISIGAMG